MMAQKRSNIRNIVISMLACIVVICAGIFSFFVMRRGAKPPFTRTCFGMGTVVSFTLYDGTEKESAALENRILELEKTLSWRVADGETARLNAAGKLDVSAQLATWIADSKELCTATDGALDITARPLIALWGIETNEPRVPEKSDIADVLKQVNYQNVNVEGDTVTLEDGVTLDLGAVGKGIALDVSKRILDDSDVSAGIVTVGGSILTYGENPNDKTGWHVAVQSPDEKTGVARLTLLINGTACISTSGDYEKYFMKNGIRYHHIFDTKTGYPADGGIRSVTVICDNGLVSDGLSTACFVLGYERSLPVLRKYGAHGVFIMEDGEIRTSENFPYQYITN